MKILFKPPRNTWKATQPDGRIPLEDNKESGSL
jgi:hypothetical protein